MAKPVVPDPPNDPELDGYGFVEELEGSGWYAVPSWGSKGWDLGSWPYVIICHFDGDAFGKAVYCEGDLNVEAFETEDERNRSTDGTAVYYWCHYDVKGAPRTLSDGRLGPYRP